MRKQYFNVKVAGGNPDPAVFCPLNGYVADPSIYMAPITIPIPFDESIILLCSNTGSNTIQCNGTGALTYAVYDSNNSLVITTNRTSNGVFLYNFPTTIPNSYFFVKVTPQATYHITTFVIASHTTYAKNQPIEAAVLNAPYLTTTSVMFQSVFSLKSCIIASTLDLCTDMSAMFSGTQIINFKFPSSLLVCTSLGSMFNGSTIVKIDFNNCNIPKLTSLSYFASSCVRLQGLDVNITAPLCYNFSYMLNGSSAITYCYLNFSIQNAASTINYDRIFMSCTSLQYVIMPDTGPASKNCGYDYAFYSTYALIEITFRGVFSVATSFVWGNNNALKKTTCTGSINSSSGFFNYGKETVLEELIFQKNITGVLLSANVSVKAITILEPSPSLLSFSWFSPNLTSFNYPTLTFCRLWIGISALNMGPLSTLVVDWANSVFPTGTSGSPIILVRGNLSSAQLNAIFTALPTATSITFIEFRYNPGYNAADKTIATIKNYYFT